MEEKKLDVKKELLMFLYENRNGTQNVNDVLKASDMSAFQMRYFLREIKDAGIIQINPEYNSLGNHTSNGRGNVLSDLNNTTIRAKLTTLVGEDYVEKNYLKRDNPSTSITATNVHIGNNSGSYTQHLNPPAENKEKKEGFLKTTGTIVAILAGTTGATWVIIQIWHYYHPVTP